MIRGRAGGQRTARAQASSANFKRDFLEHATRSGRAALRSLTVAALIRKWRAAALGRIPRARAARTLAARRSAARARAKACQTRRVARLRIPAE